MSSQLTPVFCLTSFLSDQTFGSTTLFARPTFLSDLPFYMQSISKIPDYSADFLPVLNIHTIYIPQSTDKTWYQAAHLRTMAHIKTVYPQRTQGFCRNCRKDKTYSYFNEHCFKCSVTGRCCGQAFSHCLQSIQSPALPLSFTTARYSATVSSV